MRFCYFAFFRLDDPSRRVSAEDLASARETVRALAGLAKAHLYTPETAQDLYNTDRHGPALGLQLFFDEMSDLEAAVGRGGGLQALAAPGAMPSLEGADATQQAMLLRRFPVVEERPISPQACSYVVHYPGPAADFNAWIAHYVAHHPPIMKRFPGVREIEVLTRLDWIDAMPWRRANHMQRNRVMFDSPAALTEALHSPVRHEMRADYATFPPYEGGNEHFPMATGLVLPD